MKLRHSREIGNYAAHCIAVIEQRSRLVQTVYTPNQHFINEVLHLGALTMAGGGGGGDYRLLYSDADG